MLHEEIVELKKEYEKLKGVHDTLELLPSLKLDIQRICSLLKELIDGGHLSEVEVTVKTALESMYNILQATQKGITDESLAGLFGNPGK